MVKIVYPAHPGVTTEGGSCSHLFHGHWLREVLIHEHFSELLRQQITRFARAIS
jgi:hypothetical protein